EPGVIGATRADSLDQTLLVHATAISRGRVEVSVRVNQAGFAPVTFRDSVVVLERWVSVGAGTQHTCGVTVDSAAYCWGVGPLGDGVPIQVTYTPIAVVSPFGAIRFGALD